METNPPTITPDPPKYEYRVVPFVASVDVGKGADAAAAQLQNMIQLWAGKGWEYVRLENVQTYIAGSNGCFGIGATAATMTAFSMVVFRK